MFPYLQTEYDVPDKDTITLTEAILVQLSAAVQTDVILD